MRPLLAVMMTAVCAGRVQAGDERAPVCEDMVGVWEYVEPSAPGHAIIARQGERYLGIFVNTLSEPYTEGTKAPAGTSKTSGPTHPYSVAGAWEYTCTAAADKLRLTLVWLYSSYRPQDVGSQVVLEVELAGRQGKWWFIGPDGKRGTMGAGRRLP
jgi:hypothetical protein